MLRTGEHAVVVGASIGGLTAARALADAYERVTIVERDRLPAYAEGRHAVPQGAHVHALLPSGQRALDELLPGFSEELVAAGAVSFEPLTEMRVQVSGHELAHTPIGIRALSASRPLIEGHIRCRVLAMGNVEAMERADAVGLAMSADGRRVRGLRVLRRADGSAEQLLAADLVVAASGRAGRVGAWLDGHGYPRPEEDRLSVHVKYATRALRLRPGALEPEKLVLVGARPGLARGLALCAVEGGRWLLTVSGFGPGNHPPTDERGFLEFAATVAPPDVMASIREAEPLGGIARFAYPANQRRRYERLRRFPEGLVVTGDAIAAFNPIHGQGMSVAALEALELRRCLERGAERLGPRFFRAASRLVDHAWQLAAGDDLALPEVEGERSLRVRVMNAYIERLLVAAETDPVVARRFMRVGAMLDPLHHVLSPALGVRALRAAVPRRSARQDDGQSLSGASSAVECPRGDLA